MSITLSVKNFSCITEAELQLRRLTILIGPQSSGKSLLSKLLYFFIDIMSSDQATIWDESEDADFKDHLKSKFKEWFPRAAWGKKKFEIIFTAGNYEIKILRTEYVGELGEDFRVQMSTFAKSLADKLKGMYHRYSSEEAVDRGELRPTWRLLDYLDRTLARENPDDFVSLQTFIPAGRSFFTSIGKAIYAFENSGVLDAATLRFGRMFITARDNATSVRAQSTHNLLFKRESLRAFFGGDIVFKRGNDFVKTSDGRKLPFSMLSSGHQELLPLLTVLTRRADTIRRRSNMIYIEEPEAHLFPAAQGMVTEILAELTGMSEDTPNRLLITTHSPYVLSKVNNLMKAGGFRGTPAEQRAADIVPKQAWLQRQDVAAYSLNSGLLTSIMNDDLGMIDGEYLDSVSSAFAQEFDQLLALEGGT